MVAAQLRDLIASGGVNLPDHPYNENDPLNVFRFAATLGGDMCKKVEEVLTEAELHASRSASPTPSTDAFMRAWRHTGRLLAVVSNNSQAAVEAYLAEDPTRIHMATNDPSITDEHGDKPGLRIVFSSDRASAGYNPGNFNRLARLLRSHQKSAPHDAPLASRRLRDR
jgi:hypothetical protein